MLKYSGRLSHVWTKEEGVVLYKVTVWKGSKVSSGTLHAWEVSGWYKQWYKNI